MRVAAVTMVWNQPEFLAIWAAYYGAQLGPERLYVVDHGSDPAASASLPPGANAIRVPRGEKDEFRRSRFIGDFVRSLLHHHDAVLFADADEIIAADPERHATLAAAIAHHLADDTPVVAPVGVEVLHLKGREPSIDWRRPVLGQRRYGRFYAPQCKPVIVRRATGWTVGMHHSTDVPAYTDGLILFHLKCVDADHALRRLAATRALTYAASNLRAKLSVQHRWSDDEHLDHYFHAPARILDRDGPAPWRFDAQIAALREGRWGPGRPFQSEDLFGPPLAIPERFHGIA